MIPGNPQMEENEREMNEADESIEVNREIEAHLRKCVECGVLYDPRDGRATKCRSCYQHEMHVNEAAYHNMRRGEGEF